MDVFQAAVVRPLLRRRNFTVVTSTLFAALFLLYLVRVHNLHFHRPYRSASDGTRAETTHSFDTVEIDVHLLVPATEPNVELCKGLLSAAVLEYPAPTLINWHKEFTSPTLSFNGSHIGKIDGVLEYLNGVPNFKGDQLVLMIDGYDLWFQLPPSVLHSRFRTMGKQLLALTTATYGRRMVERERISQSIIMGAEKGCGPGKQQMDHVACYGQPASPIREDLYGSGTDVQDEKTHLPLRQRPSFLNSGFALGPIKNMKPLMQRARQKAYANEDHLGSDQRIFNEIYGEQAYYRELLRQRHRKFPEKIVDALRGVLGMSAALITDAHPTHKPANVSDRYGPYEFGLSLDYGLELTQAMVLSEFDGRFLTYGQPSLGEQISGDGMPDPPRIEGLPTDIAKDTFGVDWAEQALYTNLWTGSVPVTLHMNGIKAMRQAIWKDMWFFKTAKKKILERSEKIALDPQGLALSWGSVCGPYESEIFDTG